MWSLPYAGAVMGPLDTGTRLLPRQLCVMVTVTVRIIKMRDRRQREAKGLTQFPREEVAEPRLQLRELDAGHRPLVVTRMLR